MARERRGHRCVERLEIIRSLGARPLHHLQSLWVHCRANDKVPEDVCGTIARAANGEDGVDIGEDGVNTRLNGNVVHNAQNKLRDKIRVTPHFRCATGGS